ncbi:hypothetical protein SLS53_007372 [Cytospora paraplurivora]|uniref:F-box domain-containing protein n=1 Tax=Cytospora paraplurivora TaxID=2898453 RepID=A0AAN9YDT9_9PEZI
MYSQRGILRLPLELLQDILTCLADPRSLACAIQASRALYYSFKGNEQHILTAAMTNCIGAGVLREAQLARDCSPPILNTRVVGYPVDPHKMVGEELEEEQRTYLAAFLLHNWPESGDSVRKSWAISDALALGKYHTEVILPLKDRFIKAASDPASCTMAAKLRKGLEVRSVTNLEEERICRALYRFELFRRVYGCNSRLEWLAGVAQTFLHKFAPWEIAQLGCIHDFLGEQITPVFNDIARHDVVWGNFRVGFDAEVDNGTIQNLLALGLEEILAIIRLQDSPYEARRKSLSPEEEAPYVNDDFLWFALVNLEDDAIDANLYSTLYSAPPFHPDPDPGPELTWRLSCPQDRSSMSIYDQHDWISRRWGYVFWDYARLQGLILTGDALTSATWEPRVNPVRKPEPPPSDEEREASYQVRSSIYRRGGRGYWAEDDESRVQWLEKTISS